MHIAVISDIHSNLEALERVLERIRQERPDAVACLGDIVGYGPFPNECVDLVSQYCSIVVRGNHDAGAVGTISAEDFNREGKAAIEWTRLQLTAANLKFLKDLPVTSVSEDVTYVHASPREPERWDYVANWQDVAEVFDHVSTTFCCIGHTHIPAVVAADGAVNNFRKGQKHLVNVGSVGQPRDGNPRASFALLDTEAPSASIIRVEYDVAATADAIKKAGLPEFLARRLKHGI